MIALVSILFIAMIPIDCKITHFSLYLFVCFLGKNYRMTTNIIFVGATLINY